MRDHEPSKSAAVRCSRGSIALTAIVAGCAAPQAPVPAAPESNAARVTVAEHSRGEHAAHTLVIDAASCWFGGLWGDIQGESPDERKASAARRCDGVVRSVFGAPDKARYEQLRALESDTVDAVAVKVAMLANADPADASHKDALVALVRGLADAQKETTLARRAAQRIVRDVDHEPEKLSSDEAAALPDIEATRAFDALTRLDAGGLQKEAHAFALLVLLDRMNVAQTLPVHLKPYPLVDPFHVVFGVAAPELPHDASKPLPRGGWLAYLTTAAAAAGHPVPQPAAPPQIRHERAVAGILAGISDKLKADAPGVAPDSAFAPIVQRVIRDLDGVSDARSPK